MCGIITKDTLNASNCEIKSKKNIYFADLSFFFRGTGGVWPFIVSVFMKFVVY